jgi:hypothetical protein
MEKQVITVTQEISGEHQVFVLTPYDKTITGYRYDVDSWQFAQRTIAASAGMIYFLVSTTEIYVGQTKKIERFNQHRRNPSKQFDNVIAFSSPHTLDWDYIEAHYIEKVINSQYHISNLNSGLGTLYIDDSDRWKANLFISKVDSLLVLLGINLKLTAKKESDVDIEPTQVPPSIIANLPQHSRDLNSIPSDALFSFKGGKMQVQNGKLIVLEGSLLQTRRADKQSTGARKLDEYSEFIRDGVLHRSIEFSSPSTAGEFVNGGAEINGWTAWKTAGGKTLDDWARGL